MGLVQYPGAVFTQDYPYQPRWYYGQPGDLKVISAVALETIQPGTLVEVAPGYTTDLVVRQARGGAQPLAGIAVYDPDHFDHSVIYQQGDTMPVLRRGSAFVVFAALAPPFAQPAPMQKAAYYPFGTSGAPQGAFTCDSQGILLPQGVFSPASSDYYANTDGSPAADIPYPQPPLPFDMGMMVFGEGCALVELNLG